MSMKFTHLQAMAYASALTILGVSAPALANNFKCDKAQSFCTIDSKQLTIGDRVGFFNHDEELVAYGEVEKVEHRTRYVKIEKSTGKLKANHSYALLDDNKYQNLSSNYKMYRESAQMAVGADASLASVGLGDGALGIGASVYGNWRWQQQLYLSGRAFFVTTGGSAISVNSGESRNESFTATMLGVMPGLQWITPQHKPFSARAEAGLGLAYSSASVSGGASVKEHLDHLEPGFGLAMRGSVGVQANFKEWHPTLDVAVNRVQSSNYRLISLGVMRDLK